MISGIYQIKNRINNKRYIGSAVNLKKRWRQHLNNLCRRRHYNKHLQAAFNKYGEEAFVFSILEKVEEPENLIGCEQHYLDILKPEYNISPIAGSPMSGRHHTKETCAKIGTSLIGKMAGERHPMYGKQHSAETRAKMGVAHVGKHLSAEARTKLSVARTGKCRSTETRAKISASMTGKHLSAETRAKISASLTGKRRSAETRARMSVAQTGKHHSVEAKRKMSEARKAYWQRVRKAKNQ